MKYITVAQLGERWGITPRYIQNMCKTGRLPGAVRFGKSWMIPEDAERPADLRYKSSKTSATVCKRDDEVCFSVMAATYKAPGSEKETLESLSENPDAEMLARAQFLYLHGETDASSELAGQLLFTANDFEIKIGCIFLIGICAMYRGDVKRWLETEKLLSNLPCPSIDFNARKEMWLAIYRAIIYDASAYPEWFRLGCFDSLPPGYYPAARVHYMKYLYMLGDTVVKKQPLNKDMLRNQLFLLPAICEPLISQTAAEHAIVSEIYLRLICASSYHHAGKDEHAIRHIDRALALALPDRIFAPLAEQRLNLDSLIDVRLKKLCPEALGDLKQLHAKMINGWSVIYNTIMKRSHTTELTSKEFETARLAVFGLSNKEIAARMNVSINSVKAYLQAAKDKTGVKKRSELAKFI